MNINVMRLTLGVLITVSFQAVAIEPHRSLVNLLPFGTETLLPTELTLQIHDSLPSTRVPVSLYHSGDHNAVIATGYLARRHEQAMVPGIVAFGCLNCFSACRRQSSTDNDNESCTQSSSSQTGRTGHQGSGDGNGDKPPFSSYEKSIKNSDPLAGQKREYLALIRALLQIFKKQPRKVAFALEQNHLSPNHALKAWSRSFSMPTPTGPKSFSALRTAECDEFQWMSIFSALSSHHNDRHFDLSEFIYFFINTNSANKLSLIIQSEDECVAMTELPDSKSEED